MIVLKGLVLVCIFRLFTPLAPVAVVSWVDIGVMNISDLHNLLGTGIYKLILYSFLVIFIRTSKGQLVPSFLFLSVP